MSKLVKNSTPCELCGDKVLSGRMVFAGNGYVCEICVNDIIKKIQHGDTIRVDSFGPQGGKVGGGFFRW